VNEAFEDAVKDVAQAIRQTARVTVLTGAGISAASGVPTFRGAGGLWREYRPEEIATPAAFRRDPQLVWEWYDWRRQNLAACRPNEGHRVLAHWSVTIPDFTLITQNVDGLHEDAGTTNVVRLHGSIWRVRCVRHGCAAGAAREDRRVPMPELPPRCDCGALLRPDIVWFGEALEPESIERAQIAAADCDVFLTVGTSSVVYPAASLVHEARAHGAYTVEVNPEPTGASNHVDRLLRGPAEKVLVAIADRIRT
jgi:NAD-dependent deacetylase